MRLLFYRFLTRQNSCWVFLVLCGAGEESLTVNLPVQVEPVWDGGEAEASFSVCMNAELQDFPRKITAFLKSGI